MGRTRGLLLLLHVLGRQLGLLGVGRGHLHGHGLLARHEAGGLRVWHLAGRALHAGLGGLGRTLHLHLLLLLNLLLLPNASAVEGLQDEMRAAFNQSFQSINLWTLPTPGTGAQPTEAGDARATVGVPDGFEQAVGGLKAYLATQLHEPRVFDGSELFYLTIYSFMTSACWRGKDKPDAYKRNLVPLLAFVIKYVQSLEATSPLKAIGAGAVTAGAVAVAGAGAVAVAGVVILPGAFLGAAVFGAYKTAEYAYYYHRGRALKEERKEEERRSAKTKK